MCKIIKNVFKILFKRKGFVFTTFLLPILVILLFSALYSSNSSAKVAIFNNDNGELGNVIVNRLKSVDGINIVEGEKERVEDLIFHKYEMAIIIDKDYSDKVQNGELSEIRIKSLDNSSSFESIVSQVISNESKSLITLFNNIDLNKTSVDEVLDEFNKSKPEYKVVKGKEEKTSINTSIGMILYVICISTGMSVVFLLEDEREGTKSRILMSKVSEKTYYSSMCLIFFILSSIPAIEYFIACKLFNYEFGFSNTIYLLILLLLIVLVFVVLSILLTTIVKKKNLFTLLNGTLTLPMFMLSGCFWPYEFMSDKLQSVGALFPPRWFMEAVEKLQSGSGFVDVLPEIFGLLIITVTLLLLSIFLTRNKMVLVKDK